MATEKKKSYASPFARQITPDQLVKTLFLMAEHDETAETVLQRCIVQIKDEESSQDS